MSMLNDCLPSSYLWINAAEGADRMVYLKKGGGSMGKRGSTLSYTPLRTKESCGGKNFQVPFQIKIGMVMLIPSSASSPSSQLPCNLV